MKPICVPCQRFFRVKKNGVAFIEAMPKPGIGIRDCEPGTAAPEKWQPYKLWMGDLWECRGCGAQIISGTGSQPIAQHYQADFIQTAANLGAQLQVNDC